MYDSTYLVIGVPAGVAIAIISLLGWWLRSRYKKNGSRSPDRDPS